MSTDLGLDIFKTQNQIRQINIDPNPSNPMALKK